MKRQFSACKPLAACTHHVPSILNSFPVIRAASAKNRPISRTAAHIFVSPGDAPAIITQYVAWMKRQFNACQTPRIMYPSIFNSFPVIRTAIAKTSRFHVPQPTFLFPLETPLRLSPNMFHGWKDNSMLAKPLGKTRMARLPHGEKFRRYLYSFWRNSRT